MRVHHPVCDATACHGQRPSRQGYNLHPMRAWVLVIAASCSAAAEHGTKPAPAPHPSSEPLAIALRDSGEIRIADQPVDDAALDQKLSAAAAHDRDVQVYVQVDKAVARARVEDVIARARAAGLQQITVTDLPPDTVSGTPPAPLGLTWDMHVDGDQLRIDYTVTNSTDHRVTVVDALWKSGGGFDSDSILVRADMRADTITFTRAFVPPGPNWRVEHVERKLPHYVDLPPHGELRGTAHTKLPLGAVHNFAGSYAITGARASAVLEVGFFEDPSVDASAARATKHVADKWLRGEIKPLPAGVQVASPQEQVDRGWNVVLPGR